MNAVLLAIDIILAVSLTILVLLQRSEGGAMGALGGGNGNSLFTGRQAGNILTRLTWWLFAFLVITNLLLVILAKQSTVAETVSLVPTQTTQSTPTENAPEQPAEPAQK